ncbi:PREDICTED: protein YIPF5 isoform X2 [Ceratosolen solmsi marchali]|uniref:Protein YIPF5 isoform X2 n=1 Tax=Ceratosolen solmsi marchali TaxID=326594 RepID=A0AAJ6YVQ9_9HYME|nr:PREDICTED: protein YIPF5 isoform X2 [Ceratosolen solmsi marchali]
MAGYSQKDKYWTPSIQNQFNFENSSFNQSNQQFDFATYNDQQSSEYGTYLNQEYLNPNQTTGYVGNLFKPNNYNQDEEDEPPLLEELGINPDRIVQKTLAVLNPFHRDGQADDVNYLLQDTDLAGPIGFCLLLAGFLLLAGSKAHFGYVYGLAVTSCILMYILQSLMSNTENITLASVASILGYCILPVVGLAGLGIFTSLRGFYGLILAVIVVAWATLSSSRLFCVMSGDNKQRFLIAYPCLLLYGVFTLIIIF